MISEYFGLARFVAAVGIAGIVIAVCFFCPFYGLREADRLDTWICRLQPLPPSTTTHQRPLSRNSHTVGTTLPRPQR